MSPDSFPTFDKERWARLDPLLDQALEMEPPERAAWLERLRTEDVALAEEVAALLARHEKIEAEGFLDARSSAPPPRAGLAGLVLGAYTLSAPLGQGGMGSVWLAERSDGRFSGRAAVKLLNVSLIGQEGEARFKREASILARLRHPNIARLIDAGLSSLGQPYIVLEHVDGEPIDRYCASRGLEVERRLAIFLDVLDAVAHAHANLIVHRDLKPQNVLVDREGRARLLDFGIAKLIDPEPGDAVTVTREGAAMTPEFAAPEQLTGGDVTTATDVYSLGVLLCVLLTGRHPAGYTPKTPAACLEAIVQTESRTMSDLAAEAEAGRLRARLRGDLDNIAAKTLKKAPGDRYLSVEAFADDLRRHLRHEPVSARPDTLAYRAAKLCRRHPFGVSAAAAATIAAILFTAGIAWQSLEARRQRDEARSQMARATAAREFMGFLLTSAFPPGSDLSSGNLLEQGEAVIDKEFAGSDPLRVEMLVEVGKQYMASERYDRATPVLERAAAIAEGNGDPVLEARALCPLAMMHVINGDKEKADALMTRALAGLPDEPLHDLQRAECLIERGSFGFFYEEAEPMKRDGAAALALLGRLSIPTASKRIDAMAVLAYGHYLARESREADAAYADLMRALQNAGRDRTLLAADTCNNWSLVHYGGNIAKAEPLARRAVEIRRSIEGAGGIAPSVTFNHAGVLLQLARYDEAEKLYEETIRTARARKDPRIETDAMLELADLYIVTGDLARAGAQLETLGPLLAGPDPDPFRVVQMSYYRGRLALAKRDAAEARDRFGFAVDAFEKRNSRLGMRVHALIGLARAHLLLGDAAAAAEKAGHAAEVAASFVEPDTPSYLIGLSQTALGEAEAAAGHPDAARAAFGKALDHLKVTLGDDHPETTAARRGLSVLGR